MTRRIVFSVAALLLVACAALAPFHYVSGQSSHGNRASSTNLAAPGPIGGTTASTGAFTTLTATGEIDSGVNGGTAGVVGLFGSTAGKTTMTAGANGNITFNVPASQTLNFSVNGVIIEQIDNTPHIYANALADLNAVNNVDLHTSGLIALGGTSHPNVGFNSTKGQHFVTQAANNDLAGVCTASAATTCTVSFTTAYTATPVCTATDVTGTTTVSKVTPATGSLIITTAASSSDAIDYICFGSPN
jgi:hypothetical protein